MNATSSIVPSTPSLPDLGTAFPGPFPSSPYAGQVEQHLLRWAGASSLLASPDALRALCNITGQGVARTLPTADPDSLTLCGELMVWLVAFDDVHAEATAVRDPVRLVDHVGELIRVLSDDATTSPDDPFAAGLQDLLTRFQNRATQTQYLRLTGHLRDNLVGLVWEAHHLAAPEHVTVSAYCAMRPYTVFIRTVTATVQIALAYELSDEQQSSAPVRQLETAVANVAGWVNDLVSFTRETKRLRTIPLSLPTVLMAEHHLDLPQAFARAARMCEKQAAIARARINELSTAGPSPIMLHAQALEHIVHSFIWHVSHDRYGPASTGASS